MRDIDHDLELLLDRMATEAGEPGPLPWRAARRATTRRAAALAGVGLVVVGVFSGGGYLATALRGDGDDRQGLPVTVGPDDLPAESNDRTPPEGMRGDLVAQGESDGVRWWLTAYLDGDQNLCTDFFTEDESGGGGGGGGCGPFDPERHPIGLGVQSGDGSVSASGDVPLEVDRLELVLRDGSSSSITNFHDAPEGFDLPVKFYVLIPFPEAEAEELVAYNAAGEVVGRQEIFNSADEPKTSRVAGPFVIDEGEHEGIPYVFKGRVEEQRLQDGKTWTYPCHEFMLGEGERYGGGGGCDIPLARDHEINFSQTSFETQPDIVAVHGGVEPGVDRVEVQLDSGERFDARIFGVPETEFGFYLVFPHVPRNGRLSGDIVAYRGSEEVERLELCDPHFATLGSSCGP